MKGRISNPQGDVMIRTDVIAKYAGSMAELRRWSASVLSVWLLSA